MGILTDSENGVQCGVCGCGVMICTIAEMFTACSALLRGRFEEMWNCLQRTRKLNKVKNVNLCFGRFEKSSTLDGKTDNCENASRCFIRKRTVHDLLNVQEVIVLMHTCRVLVA